MSVSKMRDPEVPDHLVMSSKSTWLPEQLSVKLKICTLGRPLVLHPELGCQKLCQSPTEQEYGCLQSPSNFGLMALGKS